MNHLPSTLTWPLKVVTCSNDILLSLQVKFTTDVCPPAESVHQFYDDFDSHLWRSDHLLCKSAKTDFQLYQNDQLIDTIKTARPVQFWWHFSEGLLRSKLKKLTGLRAILPIASLDLLKTSFLLRNCDQKIVVRGSFTQVIGGSATHCYLTLEPLRGYQKEFDRAVNIIQASVLDSVNDFGLKFLLLSTNSLPAQNKLPEKISIDKTMEIERAVRVMAVAMLNEAQRNVEGVISDIDTEFLHHYRVGFRKVRSLLALLKKALPVTMIAHLRAELSIIAGKTNKLRDLDVFLLEQERYRLMLPVGFENGLDELYKLINSQRKREKNAVATYLASEAYQTRISVCLQALAEEPMFETTLAAKPVLAVVKKLLLKRYQKMLSMSRAINKQTTDEEIHQLRIEFKKLRYLIEFFVDLFPKKRVHKLLAEIKKVQTVLGDFNDYCVQIDFLTAYMDHSKIELTKALSGLIAILHQKLIEQRITAEAALVTFFTEEMTIEFNLQYGAESMEKVGESV
ncbi:MAG: CHAD domain-containing protein [Mariprofundus sp.]|nr:CHAD domain-containing protein [Mariprofundus sp.]